ncbi:MAG: sulfur carrier protein ThiS [Verrucomicrobiota bacterium]
MSKESQITVKLNGETKSFEHSTTLMDLVEAHGLKVNSILIELNGEAVLRSKWRTRVIKQGDQLEFLRVVAGG